MPMIRPNLDLKNNYNEISTMCHQTKNPIFITKNGFGDLAVMSIEVYERLTNKIETYEEFNGRQQQVFKEVKPRATKDILAEI